MRILVPILTLLALLLTACAGAYRSVLEQADAIMEERPDSALALLLSIDRSRLGDGDLPYYALLMTQAQVKTDVPLASDSLISIAYAKYADAWSGDKGIRSAFYLGEVFFNQDRPREAMRQYLSAFEDSKRLGNDYWHAKSAERIADLFFNAYNYPEAARYRKKAIEFFGEADRVTNQRYAIADLVFDFVNDAKYDEAISLLDSIYDITLMENPKDSLLLNYIKTPRIDILLALGRIDEIDSLDYRLLNREIGKSSGIEASIINNQVIQLKGQNDYCQLDDIDLSGSSAGNIASILYSNYQNARISGNAEAALNIVDSLLIYQDSVAQYIIKESVTGAERDFYSELSVTHRQKSNLYFVLFIAACFIALFIWRIYRWRAIASRIRLEATIESFVELQARSDKDGRKMVYLNQALDEKNVIIGTLEDELARIYADIIEKRQNIEILEKTLISHSEDLKKKDMVLECLFREKWTTLNMLCNEYYEKGESPNMRNHIVDCIEKELKKISSKKGLAQIESAVNTQFDGIMSLLRAECPKLSEKEFSLALLIISGFSGKAISYLLGIKTGNYYVSKQRLILRISQYLPPHEELFISRLQ